MTLTMNTLLSPTTDWNTIHWIDQGILLQHNWNWWTGNAPLVYVLVALQCFNPTKPLKMSPTWRSSGMHGCSLMHNWAGKYHWRHRNFLDLESSGTSATKWIVSFRWDIFQINQEDLNRLIPASRSTSLNAWQYVWGIGQCNILLLHIAFTFWPCESVRKTRLKFH